MTETIMIALITLASGVLGSGIGAFVTLRTSARESKRQLREEKKTYYAHFVSAYHAFSAQVITNDRIQTESDPVGVLFAFYIPKVRFSRRLSMFYQRILKLCAERGVKITNVIAKMGMGSGNLSKWKAGGMPKGDTLSKLADYFQVSTDYLLGRTDDPRPSGEAAEPSPLRSTLLNNFEQLNPEGQERLVETSDDMVSSGKYKKVGAFSMGTKEA